MTPKTVLKKSFPNLPGPVSLLGYGGIRLPSVGRNKDAIDYPAAERLIDLALARGVNYFDTGWIYHAGNSERFYGKALSRHPRDSYFLTDKMPTWVVKSRAHAERLFEEQLKRCRTDHFDFYLLHSVDNVDTYRRVYLDWGILDWLRAEKKRGRIRSLGMSFHGKSDRLAKVLETFPDCETCTVLLNPLEGRRNPDNAKMRDLLVRRGIPMVVMEPLAGGRLARLQGKARAILEAAAPGRSPAAWAFRYAASEKGILSIISGMNEAAQVTENVETLSEPFVPLSAAERQAYDAALDVYLKHRTVPCSECRYCVPCPYGVKIPEVFAWWNGWAAMDELPAEDGGPNDTAKRRRDFLRSHDAAFPRAERASALHCIGCRKCLKACPQWIFKIPDELAKIDAFVDRVRRRAARD